jgi:hypothetical protein
MDVPGGPVLRPEYLSTLGSADQVAWINPKSLRESAQDCDTRGHGPALNRTEIAGAQTGALRQIFLS